MKLCQFFTPMWVAEALVERFFPKLSSSDFVVEPSCGRGSFLRAIPSHVLALGVEVDPVVAAVARAQTGREVLVGDFRTVEITRRPDAIIGNPPFAVPMIDAFLQRSHELLSEGGRVGFLLPAYAMQTSRRVCSYSERFSMQCELVPRDVFPRLREPLVFAVFIGRRLVARCVPCSAGSPGWRGRLAVDLHRGGRAA